MAWNGAGDEQSIFMGVDMDEPLSMLLPELMTNHLDM